MVTQVDLQIMRLLGLVEPDPMTAEIEKAEAEYSHHQDFFARIDSPIEKAFWSVGYFALKNYGDLIPQYAEYPYFIDFALINIPSAPHLKIAIELDGHDTHKTKEQRDKDTERERYLMRRRWQVIRFTGTQITHDAESCVIETVELVEQYIKWLRTG